MRKEAALHLGFGNGRIGSYVLTRCPNKLSIPNGCYNAMHALAPCINRDPAAAALFISSHHHLLQFELEADSLIVSAETSENQSSIRPIKQSFAHHEVDVVDLSLGGARRRLGGARLAVTGGRVLQALVPAGRGHRPQRRPPRPRP
jgi:hypothetical protein